MALELSKLAENTTSNYITQLINDLNRLQDYSNDSLQEYFEQNALAMPVETIIEKTEARDFNYFLEHGNFFKVVDTLEKFETQMVNTESQAGKEFVLFKRQLYQMYEVKQRSIWEHETFSMTVDRRSLKWLHDANRDFLMELQQVNLLDQLQDIEKLNENTIYQAKFLSEDKQKGLAAWAATALAYSKFTALTLLMGKMLPSAAITAGIMYGMHKFNDVATVQKIEMLEGGNYKITVKDSMFTERHIIADAKDTWAISQLDELQGQSGE